MLEPLGVTTPDEHAYRVLLTAPGSGVPELAVLLNRTEADVAETVGRLETLGLLTRAAERLLPTRPDVAVDTLVAVRRAEHDRVRAEAREMMSALREQELHQPENLVEVVVGQESIAARFAQLLNGTHKELLVLDRPPYAAVTEDSDTRVRGLLREGVTVRGIYSPDSFERPGGLDEAYSAADAGETSRTHPTVPMKLAVFDRQAALLPLSVDALVDSALVVHPCSLLNALVEMFTLLWEQAVPVVPAEAPEPLDSRLLTLLSAGLKDDAIARQLNLSSRTVGRRVAELMDTLGARTRFQAGVHAQRRRLLGE
ncbi:helix-turn-helix transcriptional regulator [Kribbella sandramycini]|uniref:DNA-binding NarL/FixJ family response regulator n=1 Tax=Kribbella sandramycini TaxID=60450 RepID=A0A7Y4L029_9ACTN|nr:helix-turn-helix transcriptional regulator [Kribbella sandramycini]MBB6569315.1 DNA-binding NarL/FixJ family response regulator [Kribbella sandramycini]NOL40846.1 helix-turn-helix transcriptional regulator [Kribbella sandramycini]